MILQNWIAPSKFQKMLLTSSEIIKNLKKVDRKTDSFCTLVKPYQQLKMAIFGELQHTLSQPSVGRFLWSIRILKELNVNFTKLCDFVGFHRFYTSKSGEENFDFLRFRDLKNRRLFEIYTIFHTKILKDGPTSEIGAMCVEYIWVGSMPPNKETGGSSPLGIRNQASDKFWGSNVAADFFRRVEESIFDDRARMRFLWALGNSAS